MSKPITIGQSHNLVSILINNTDWSVLDGDVVQGIINNPLESGKQFTAFLKNGGKMIIDELKIIQIDRSQPFDPIKFLGNGWSIEEEDKRSLTLTELDLTKIRFEIMLRKGETFIRGEEKLRRLKETDYIRLDVKVFQTFWENQILIPERFKEKVVYFDGTVLRGPGGGRCVLSLCWRDGQWDWSSYWLELDWYAGEPSAVLASI